MVRVMDTMISGSREPAKTLRQITWSELSSMEYSSWENSTASSGRRERGDGGDGGDRGEKGRERVGRGEG